MPTVERTLAAIKEKQATIEKRKEEERGLRPESFLDERSYDARRERLNAEIRELGEEAKAILCEFERFPHRHTARHHDQLLEFQRGHEFEDLVFVMTKFPVEGEEQANELQRVIETVIAAVRESGRTPRIASERALHRWLWDNVELYLLGCSKGIAIVEDKYLPELNPNVAMEWGWMVGMGRQVLFLREKDFVHNRADWSGLLSEEFEWGNPEPGIRKAVVKFLGRKHE